MDLPGYLEGCQGCQDCSKETHLLLSNPRRAAEEHTAGRRLRQGENTGRRDGRRPETQQTRQRSRTLRNCTDRSVAMTSNPASRSTVAVAEPIPPRAPVSSATGLRVSNRARLLYGDGPSSSSSSTARLGSADISRAASCGRLRRRLEGEAASCEQRRVNRTWSWKALA